MHRMTRPTTMFQKVKKHTFKSRKSARQRSLALEPLEDRRLLAIDVTNLGLEAFGLADSFQLEGELLAIEVSEFSRQTDLNTDGDLDDVVMQVFDSRAAATTNLGLAQRTLSSGGTPEYSIEGNVLALFVSEMAQGGSDLNGDGDVSLFDQVLHVYDAREHTTTNLEVAATWLHFSGNLLAFGVSEFRQGNTDLNGDGDTHDTVLHVYDVVTGDTTNLELAADVSAIDGSRLALHVSESAQGNSDLNGDGDSVDAVLHIHDFATGETMNSALAFNTGLKGSLFSGHLAAIAVSEADQGYADLNHDGDTLDQVMHVYDLATRETTNLMLDGRSGFELDGDLLAILVSEGAQGKTDLNADGDIGDAVLHVFDGETGTLDNLGLAALGEIRMDGHLLAFVVPESRQGNVDLNGDGDMSDSVMHIFNNDTAIVTNLGLHKQGRFEWENNRLAFFVSERSQGGTDLNGDGDAFDSIVLHVFDASTGVANNVGLAGINFLELSGDLVAFGVSEIAQGGTDLNGDGDAADFSVLHVYNTRTEIAANIGYASLFFHLDGRGIAFQAMESLQGNTDLNGDGDTVDRVMHFADLTSLIPDPVVLIEQLTKDIAALDLQFGIENSLNAKLEGVLKLLGADLGSEEAITGKLQALINEIEAQQEKRISAEAADLLIADISGLLGLMEAS